MLLSFPFQSCTAPGNVQGSFASADNTALKHCHVFMSNDVPFVGRDNGPVDGEFVSNSSCDLPRFAPANNVAWPECVGCE